MGEILFQLDLRRFERYNHFIRGTKGENVMANTLYSLEGYVAEPFTKTKYDYEDTLQHIVEQNPNLLKLPSDPEEYKLYLVKREQPIPCPNGSMIWADVFLIDSLAVPVIVEVKRSSDSRIHAEVMTQTLNYAANLRNADFDEIIQSLRSSIQKAGKEDPLPHDSTEETDSFALDETFIDRLRANIESDVMKLIIVADEIPQTLENIIRFVDHAMKDISVYGVALTQYTVNDKKVITRSFVVTEQVEEKKKKSTPSVRWTQERLLKEFKECGNDGGLDNLKVILPLAEKYQYNAVYGTGSTVPTIVFKQNEQPVFSLEFGLNEKDAGILFFYHSRILMNYPGLFQKTDDVANYLYQQGFEQQKLRVGKNYTSFYLRLIQEPNNYNAIEALLSMLKQ